MKKLFGIFLAVIGRHIYKGERKIFTLHLHMGAHFKADGLTGAVIGGQLFAPFEVQLLRRGRQIAVFLPLQDLQHFLPAA